MTRLSAVVLAGGASSRFGKDKARARWGRVPLVEHAALRLAESVPDVVVVTRRPGGLEELGRRGIRVAADRYRVRHPMGGLVTGLELCRNPSAFVCAVDMPLIEPALVRLLAEAASGYEAAVPCWEGKLQPLCAVYSKRALGVLRRMADEGRALHDIFSIVPTRFVLDAEVGSVDPAGRSFRDIDTPADYRELMRSELGRCVAEPSESRTPGRPRAA